MTGHKSDATKGKGEMNSCSSGHPLNTMIHSLKQICLIGLAFAILALALPAADTKSQTDARKAGPSTLTGRVVFVDKSLRAVAIEVKGKVLQINVVSHVRLARGGKSVPFEELAAGQEVTVTFREGLQGHLEVVALSIEGSSNQLEAAGKAVQPAKRNGPPDPFPGNGNPANLGGQVHSPNH